MRYCVDAKHTSYVKVCCGRDPGGKLVALLQMQQCPYVSNSTYNLSPIRASSRELLTYGKQSFWRAPLLVLGL